MEETGKGHDDQDHFDATFNEGTTLTSQLAGSVSGRDLLDLRRDFAREMKAQTSAIQDVQSVLLRFEAVMETLSKGLAQRTLMEGSLTAVPTAMAVGDSGPSRARKSPGETAELQKKQSKTQSYDDDDEVWVPVAPCQPPPKLNLPSIVREENDNLDDSCRSVLQNISMGTLQSNRGGVQQVASVHVNRLSTSNRRQSEPCLSPRSDGKASMQMVVRVPSRHSSRHSRRSKSSGIQSRGIQGMTESIEAHMASRILRRRDREGGANFLGQGSAFSSHSVSRLSRLPRAATPPRNDATLQDEDQSSPGRRVKTVDLDLSRNRRISMEELRNRHDAVIVRTNTIKMGTRTSRTLEKLPTEGGPTALSSAAWVVLCSAGILDFKQGRPWQILSWFTGAALLLALATFVVFGANLLGDEHYIPSTMMTLILGSVLSMGNLRWVGLNNLLGPVDYSLDNFATESGFMQDWQQVSRRRSFEVLGIFLFMVSCGIASNHYGRSLMSGKFIDIVMDLVFLVVGFRCAAINFCQLHICSALELSIDSFCLSFFKEMDIDEAIQEWNMVQATLRQVSNQCSGSFFVMAAASFSTILLLGEQILRDPGSMQDWRQMAVWLGWLYPPTLSFFYAMLRAAAVTEKASRVGPLVNSWNLQEADTPLGMDTDRQYVVQYINQSQAGFFMKGVRITGFDVQKMLYYFAALTFTLVSRTLNL